MVNLPGLPSNACPPKLGALPRKIALVSAQGENADSAMLVTLERRSTLFTPLPYSTAVLSMLVTGFPSIIAGISTGPTASIG